MHGPAAATWDDVEQSAPGEVDEVGREHGVALGAGPQERHLVEPEGGGVRHAWGVVEPEGGGVRHACGVVDAGLAVVPHRRHDRRPADARVPSHAHHRAVLLAHLATRLGPGPLGQRRPRGDGGGPLGPGPDVTVGVGQRQMRLLHTTTTLRPALGHRPHAARTPSATTSAVVSTS